MIVVSDSTTLIVLANAQRFDLLNNLFSEVCVPPAVWDEIHVKAEVILPDWIKRQCVEPSQTLDTLLLLLDQGESEAILLAKALKSPLIIDEKKGRKIALQMGLDILGLLGIVYLNIKRSHITKDDAVLFLNQVRAKGYRISQTLIDAMFMQLTA